MAAATEPTSEDALLGGKLVLRQPLHGHRFGHDAVLLAAATPARTREHAIELGAGVGAAGLALARRVEGLAVTLVELDPSLAALAQENAKRNLLSERVRAVCLDAASPAAQFAAAGLHPDAADHVLMNPPFNAPHNPSPDRARRVARAASPGALVQWIETAARLLRAGGGLTLIWRADGLADVLAALTAGFGAIAVVPVYPKPQAPAIRVLIRATRDSQAPLVILPGLILAGSDNKPTAQAHAILREGAVLA
ncbi:MAG: tRNA1(Val) (adenine(37)-N6)-methyltransferase [Xanthobacteraceae bacterium]